MTVVVTETFLDVMGKLGACIFACIWRSGRLRLGRVLVLDVAN
jgi:hypothetical protein